MPTICCRVVICVAIAMAGAALLGFHGICNLSAPQRALIFLALAIFLGRVSTECVGQMIPGSWRRATPGVLLGTAVLVLLGVSKTFHISLWHTAVVPISAAAGVLLARSLHRLRYLP